MTFAHPLPTILVMTPEITISPAPGEKDFEPKRIRISPKTAGSAAADIAGGRIILGVMKVPKNPEEIVELTELYKALAKAAREA